MTRASKALKRGYRKYVKRTFPNLSKGLIDRDHCRYMGYDTPTPFRQWAKVQQERVS